MVSVSKQLCSVPRMQSELDLDSIISVADPEFSAEVPIIHVANFSEKWNLEKKKSLLVVDLPKCLEPNLIYKKHTQFHLQKVHKPNQSHPQQIHLISFTTSTPDLFYQWGNNLFYKYTQFHSVPLSKPNEFSTNEQAQSYLQWVQYQWASPIILTMSSVPMRKHGPTYNEFSTNEQAQSYSQWVQYQWASPIILTLSSVPMSKPSHTRNEFSTNEQAQSYLQWVQYQWASPIILAMNLVLMSKPDTPCNDSMTMSEIIVIWTSSWISKQKHYKKLGKGWVAKIPNFTLHQPN